MKNLAQKSRRWVMFVALFAVFFHYSYDTQAESIAGICHGQFVKVVRTSFLWWEWYHVEDGWGKEVVDDCNLIGAAKAHWGIQ